MSANVRCDGKRSELDGAVIFDSCDWEGDRSPRWWPISFGTHGIGRWGVTAEPCPDCGGQVELIKSTTGGDSGGNERSC